MGQSTEELSGEIATTRNNLASDLDALHDRVSPSAMVERRKQAARGRLRRMRDRVMGTVHEARSSTASGAASAAGSAQDTMQGTMDSARESAQVAASRAQETYEGAPLAAGLVAFGAGMVIASLFPAAEREAVAADKMVGAAKEHGAPLLDEARTQAQQATQQLGDTASQAVQEVKDAAAQGADRVGTEGRSAMESVRNDASGR